MIEGGDMTLFYKATITVHQTFDVEVSGESREEAEKNAFQYAEHKYPGFRVSVPELKFKLETKLSPGKKVHHSKFGEGIVVINEIDRVQIDFGEHGIKWLATSIARLTPVD
jgi:hypothetical protein